MVRAFLDAPPSPETTAWVTTNLHTPRDIPILEAFYITGIQPEKGSYGDREDTSPTSNIADLTIYHSKVEQTRTAIHWLIGIDNLMDEGWSICYTDGMRSKSKGGSNVKTATGVFCDNKFNKDTIYGIFGGTPCTVADSEQPAIALCLEHEDRNMLAIASDL